MKKPTKKQKKAIRNFLSSLGWLFENQWYDNSILYMEENNENTDASMTLTEAYRETVLTIYPQFFDGTPEEQAKILLHEMVHIQTIPSKSLSLQLLEGKLITEEQVTDANEKLTCYMQQILSSFLESPMKHYKENYQSFINEMK